MKKTIHGIFLLLVLLAVTLSACTSTAGPTGTEESAYPALNPQGQVIPNYPSAQTFTTAKMEDLKPPTDAPQPDEGMASISGIIYVPREQLVMTKTQFYLTAGELFPGCLTRKRRDCRYCVRTGHQSPPDHPGSQPETSAGCGCPAQ